MLAELETRHATLLALMATMRGLVSLAEPPRDEVSATRLHLTKASTARARYLAGTVYPWLLSRVDPDRARTIAALRDDTAADRARSSSHISRWSGSAIFADWPAYRLASRGILQMMNERIDREKSLLYPVLRELEQPERR